MSNLANRLRTLYGDGASVMLRTAPGGGAVTEVLLRADVAPPRADESVVDDEPVEHAPAPLPDLFRRNLAATVVTGWLLWGLFWVELNLMWMSIYARRSLPWTWPVIQNYGMGVVAWAAITPLMLASARRNSLVERAAVVAGGAARRAGLLLRAAAHRALADARPLAAAVLGSGYFETMLWTVMLYAVLLALSSYHDSPTGCASGRRRRRGCAPRSPKRS